MPLQTLTTMPQTQMIQAPQIPDPFANMGTGGGGLSSMMHLMQFMNSMANAQQQQAIRDITLARMQDFMQRGWTDRERRAYDEQERLRAATDSLINNEDFVRRYDEALQSHPHKRKELFAQMQQDFIQPLRNTYGVKPNDVYKALFAQNEAAMQKELRDIDDVSTAKTLYDKLRVNTNDLWNSIKSILPGTDNEQLARDSAQYEQSVIDQNLYLKDQQRQAQEGESWWDRTSVGGKAIDVLSQLPTFASFLLPGSAAGGLARMLGAGATGIARAGLVGNLLGGGALGQAMANQGFIRSVQGAGLTPEQEQQAIHSPEALANRAIGGVTGAIAPSVAGPVNALRGTTTQAMVNASRRAAGENVARAAVDAAAGMGIMGAGQEAATQPLVQSATGQPINVDWRGVRDAGIQGALGGALVGGGMRAAQQRMNPMPRLNNQGQPVQPVETYAYLYQQATTPGSRTNILHNMAREYVGNDGKPDAALFQQFLSALKKNPDGSMSNTQFPPAVTRLMQQVYEGKLKHLPMRPWSPTDNPLPEHLKPLYDAAEAKQDPDAAKFYDLTREQQVELIKKWRGQTTTLPDVVPAPPQADSNALSALPSDDGSTPPAAPSSELGPAQPQTLESAQPQGLPPGAIPPGPAPETPAGTPPNGNQPEGLPPGTPYGTPGTTMPPDIQALIDTLFAMPKTDMTELYKEHLANFDTYSRDEQDDILGGLKQYIQDAVAQTQTQTQPEQPAQPAPQPAPQPDPAAEAQARRDQGRYQETWDTWAVHSKGLTDKVDRVSQARRFADIFANSSDAETAQAAREWLDRFGVDISNMTPAEQLNKAASIFHQIDESAAWLRGLSAELAASETNEGKKLFSLLYTGAKQGKIISPRVAASKFRMYYEKRVPELVEQHRLSVPEALTQVAREIRNDLAAHNAPTMYAQAYQRGAAEYSIRRTVGDNPDLNGENAIKELQKKSVKDFFHATEVVEKWMNNLRRAGYNVDNSALRTQMIRLLATSQGEGIKPYPFLDTTESVDTNIGRLVDVTRHGLDNGQETSGVSNNVPPPKGEAASRSAPTNSGGATFAYTVNPTIGRSNSQQAAANSGAAPSGEPPRPATSNVRANEANPGTGQSTGAGLGTTAREAGNAGEPRDAGTREPDAAQLREPGNAEQSEDIGEPDTARVNQAYLDRQQAIYKVALDSDNKVNIIRTLDAWTYGELEDIRRDRDVVINEPTVMKDLLLPPKSRDPRISKVRNELSRMDDSALTERLKTELEHMFHLAAAEHVDGIGEKYKKALAEKYRNPVLDHLAEKMGSMQVYIDDPTLMAGLEAYVASEDAGYADAPPIDKAAKLTDSFLDYVATRSTEEMAAEDSEHCAY